MADDISIRWEGIKETSAALDDLQKRRIPEAQGNVVRMAMEEAQATAESLAPVSFEGSRYQDSQGWVFRAYQEPGQLKEGIHTSRVKKLGLTTEGEVVSTAPYSNLVEHGRKAITASNGKNLVFFAYGKAWRRRSVRGTMPHPFMAPAAEEARAFIARGNVFRL